MEYSSAESAFVDLHLHVVELYSQQDFDTKKRIAGGRLHYLNQNFPQIEKPFR